MKLEHLVLGNARHDLAREFLFRVWWNIRLKINKWYDYLDNRELR